MTGYAESPYKVQLSAPAPTLLRQELTTYEMKDGVVRRITTCREFFGNDTDYIDSQTVTIISPR